MSNDGARSTRLRVRGRALEWKDQKGRWLTLKTFRSAEAARRGLARRERDPTIAINDILRTIDKMARERLGDGWRRAPSLSGRRSKR